MVATRTQDQLRIDVEDFEAYCVASQEWLRVGYETLRGIAKTKTEEEVLNCIRLAYEEIQSLKMEFNQYHRDRRSGC